MLDSKLMADTVRAARMLVKLKETRAGTITDEEAKLEFQAMIDNGVIDLFYGAVNFITTMIQSGNLSPPPGKHLLKEQSQIILPH